MWKHLFKKYWVSILLAPIFMTGEVLADLLQPRYMNTIIDEGVLGLSNGGVGDTSLVIRLGLRMIIIVLLGVTSAVITGIFAHSCGQLFGNDLRKKCFHNVMTLSFSQIEEIGESSLATRLLNDITQVQQLVRMSISAFVRTFILFTGGIVCMLMLDLHFGLIVLLVLPIIVSLIFLFMRRSNEVFTVLQKRIDVINRIVQENLLGVRVVKAFVREDYEHTRFEKENEKLVDSQLEALLIFARLTPLMNIVLNTAVVLIILVGGIRVKAGSITPGTVIAAITYITQILNAVLSLNMIFQTISRGTACAKRIQEILDLKPAITDGGYSDTEAEADHKHGKIEFRDVSFVYPDTAEGLILDHINLTINPGETVGILGATGSGKSSFVQLVPRFWDASEGEILIDDVNVKDYTVKSLRDKISMVFQKSEIFSDTFENNIIWGDRSADKEKVREAARIAQALDFIEEKEKGFDTHINQNGTSISGGQKQRVAISRGILKKSDILILDDSTSALDLKTERRFFDSLQEKYPDMTKIIVAQRITSIKNADHIYVIDKGSIVGHGKHEELLRSSQIYADIYNSQLQGGGE